MHSPGAPGDEQGDAGVGEGGEEGGEGVPRRHGAGDGRGEQRHRGPRPRLGSQEEWRVATPQEVSGAVGDGMVSGLRPPPTHSPGRGACKHGRGLGSGHLEEGTGEGDRLVGQRGQGTPVSGPGPMTGEPRGWLAFHTNETVNVNPTRGMAMR